MKASDLKNGAVVDIDGAIYVAKEVTVKTPSSRGANTLYKVSFRNVVTKQKLDQSYRGDDTVQEVEFSRRPVQLIFRDKDSCTFMDNESYEQHNLPNDLLEEELPYLLDGMEGIQLLVSGDAMLGIELPGTVEMEIVACAPAMKGASATARSKPATLSTGLVVQVPEYLAQGEHIRINTQTGKFTSRA
jgi:elongation factor P